MQQVARIGPNPSELDTSRTPPANALLVNLLDDLVEEQPTTADGAGPRSGATTAVGRLLGSPDKAEVSGSSPLGPRIESDFHQVRRQFRILAFEALTMIKGACTGLTAAHLAAVE